MFEKEIKFVSDFSFSKVKNLGSVITFEKLAGAGLHPAITTYISAELDYMIHRDREKLLKDSIFDYSGKEISEHLKIISKEVKKNKKISMDDIGKLIMQAVSFNANYVVRPKWSLTKFIYNTQSYVTVEELELMLSYLYYYDYVKNVLMAYISKRKVVQLTLTEFDLILNKIDRELFKSNSEELINNALHSISDFFNIGGVDKKRISITSVEILLKEKNLLNYLLKLRRTFPAVSKKKYEIADIKKVLYAKTPLKPGSIQGYDPGRMEIVEEPKVEPTVEKQIDDFEMEDSEIVSEEEILNQPQEEKILFDEVKPEQEEKVESVPELEDNLTRESKPEISEDEELLPIEEEFQNEFISEDSHLEIEQELKSEFEPVKEEEQVESSIEDENKKEIFTELEDELNELIEEGISYDEATEEGSMVDSELVPEPEEVTEQESELEEAPEPEHEMIEDDELLAFYEHELELMEDENSDLEIIAEEELRSQEEDKNIIPEPPEPGFDIEEELKRADREETSDESDVISTDDFDLSIFDNAEFEKPYEQIREEEKPDNEAVSKDEVKEESEKELPIEKEIVNEMLEDYFREENKKETRGNKEESFKLAEDEFNLENDDIFADTKLDSAILDDPSIEEHISDVMDEIDNLLKNETSSNLDKEKQEQPKISPKKPEKTKDDIFKESDSDVNIQRDLFGEESKKKQGKSSASGYELHKKKESPISKHKTLKREKDFFGYLTKKEMKKIVSAVFGGDDGDFVTTIERISECSAYKEATEILKGVFFSYRVSPYSKEAVLLTNAVSNFFRQT